MDGNTAIMFFIHILPRAAITKIMCCYKIMVHLPKFEEIVDRKDADISEDIQQDVIDCVTQALGMYNIEKAISSNTKTESDKKINSHVALDCRQELLIVRYA